MARQIVTSENKAEYDDAVMSRRLREYDKDRTAAEKASELAKDNKSHFDAQLAHQRASVFAHPAENVEKHLERARHHKKESKKHEAMERKAYVEERTSNDSKKHREFMKKGDEKRRKAGTL
jgi:hypothetical protein